MARQRSFTSYVADRFYNELFAAISDFAEENSDDLNLRLYQVNRIRGIELSDITIKYVSVNNFPGSEIEFEVAIEAEFNVREADYHYDTDEFTNQWFMVKCKGDLACGLGDFQITGISIYNGKNRQPKPMSDALVPIISKDNLEAVATDFLRRNNPKVLLQPMAIDPLELAKSMGLSVKLKRITEDCSIFGQIFFQDSTAEIYDEKLCQSVEEEVSAKTILLDPETYFLYNLGKVNNILSMNAFTEIYIVRLLNWNAYTIMKRVVLSVRLLVVLNETVGQPRNGWNGRLTHWLHESRCLW